MKKLSYFLLIVSFIVFAISLVNLIFGSRLLQEQEFRASAEFTSDVEGFDLNNSALTFGRVIQGGSSTRNLVFVNGYNFPVYVSVFATGGISEFLSYEENLLVGKGETRKISFSITAPYGQEGFYEGTVKLIIRSA